MRMSRPVAPRARWTASIVDSVPEFVKRHCGSPQRRRSSSATVIEPSVGAAKCVPSSIRALTAAAMVGFAWPTHMTPKPLWKSTYSLPSTSHTFAPDPRTRYVGHGSLHWNCDGTPPGMTAEARAKYSLDFAVRSRRRARSRSISSLTRAGSMCCGAGSVADMLQAPPSKVTGEERSPGRGETVVRAYSGRGRNLVRISGLWVNRPYAYSHHRRGLRRHRDGDRV